MTQTQEAQRLKGQKATVLEMLQCGPQTNVEFVEVGILRYSARIYELRRDGHEIEAIHRGGGDWLFRLGEGGAA